MRELFHVCSDYPLTFFNLAVLTIILAGFLCDAVVEIVRLLLGS